MPRISALTLDQINRQVDTVDALKTQLTALKARLDLVGHSVAIADPIHAPSTTNNMTFTWTGATTTLSWAQGFLKTKNWKAQTVTLPAIKSSAPGQQHVYTIPAGSASLLASTYYWLGWDAGHQVMIATSDASTLHGNYNIHVICQIFTGTGAQTGAAGGGGSTGGVDLSGLRYKNF